MPAPVNLPLPVITNLEYAEGTIIVILDAEPLEAVSAALFLGSPTGTDWLAIESSFGNMVRIVIDPALLDPTREYTVALTYDRTTPDWGAATVLVFQQPTMTSVEVGKNSAIVAWSLPATTSISVVTVSIYDTVKCVTIASVTSSTASAAIVSAAPFAKDGKYQVMAQGSKGIACGPLVTLDQYLIVTAPTIANVTYTQATGGQYSITATARAEGTPPGQIVAKLLSDGRLEMQSAPADTKAVIALQQALDSAASWQVELAYRALIVTGPSGVAAAIPQQQPRLDACNYDGTQIHLAWSPPEGNPSATGAYAVIKRSSDGTVMGTASVNPGVEATITPTGLLSPTEAYSTYLAPLLGTVQGLFGVAQPLIVATPTILSMTCDGAKVFVKVQRITTPATSTRLTVCDGNNKLNTVLAGAEGGFIAIPPTGSPNLSIAVQALTSTASGPTSASIPFVTTAPTLSAISIVAGSIKGFVTAPSGAILDSTELWVRLFSDGIAITDAVKATSDGSFAITVTTQILTNAQLMTWVEGTAKGARVSGPRSRAYPVLAVAPQIVEAVLSSANGASPWTLRAVWSFPDALASVCHTVQLQQSGKTLGTWTTSGCDLQTTAPDFVATTPMTLTVTPKCNFGTGVTSTAVTFLAASPATSAECRSEGIVAHWQAPAGASPTAYRARLLQSIGGAWQTVAQSEAVSGLGATIPFLLPTSAVADTAYGLAVDTACGAAWTVTNTVSPLLLQGPCIDGVLCTQGATADQGNCTVNWSWPGGNPPASPALTSYSVLLIQEGRETVIKQQAAPAVSTSIPFPTLPAASARIAVRPVAGPMTGPCGAASPMLFAKPQLCAVEASNTGMRIAFTPVAPPEQDYLVSLLNDQGKVASCWVNESPAFMPFTGAVSGQNYRVTVTAYSADMITCGPASDPLAVVLRPAILSTASVADGILAVALTPPDSGSTAIDGYKVDLTCNGIPVQTEMRLVPIAGKLSLTLGTGLSKAGNYVLRATPIAGVATGPVCELAVVVGTPVITSALAQLGGTGGTITVRVGAGLLSDPGLAFDAVLVTDGVMGTPVPVAQGSAILPFVSGAKSCSVATRARSSSATGPWSATLPVPIALPVVTSGYDGCALGIAWTGTPGAQYGVQIIDTQTALCLAAALVNGLGATFELSPGAAATCEARVTEIAGTATGPTGKLPLVVRGCALTALSVDTSRKMTFSWQAPAATPNIKGFEPVLLWSGGLKTLDRQPAGATSGTLDLPAGVPNGASLAIRALLESATGPLGNAMPVLIEAPRELVADYDGTVLSCAWSAPADERIDGYVATISNSGQEPVIQRVKEPVLRYTPTPKPTTGLSVVVAATSGCGNGPVCESLQAIINTPAISSADYDGSVLKLGWTPVSDTAARGYRLSLMSGTVVCGEMVFGGTTGAMPLTPSPVSLQMQAFGDRTLGPRATAATALVTTAPVLSKVAISPDSGDLTIAWSTVPNAATYQVEVRGRFDAPYAQRVSGTTCTIPADSIKSGAVLQVLVRGTLGGASDPVTGPWSFPSLLVTMPPQNVRADFDGQQAIITWDPVLCPQVDAYQVNLFNGTKSSSSRTNATSLVLAGPFDAGVNYTVSVQPVGGGTPGKASARTTLFAPALYLSTDRTKSSYLVPAQDPTMSAHDITIYLPSLFTTTVSTGLPTTPPFVMAQAQAPFAYTLTIPASSDAWTFNADPMRAAITQAYSKLLVDLMKLGLTPLGWSTLQDAIARAMPQTFAETLFYEFGLRPKDGMTDLRPGMILRAEYANYQYLGPNQPSSAYINGYVGTLGAEYDVGSFTDSDGVWLTGFDSFLARICESGAKVPTPKTYQENKTMGGCGLIDLNYSQFRQPFVRLVYPPDILAQDTSGYPNPSYNAALVAAPDYATLEAASNNLRNAQPITSGAAVLYLRGRATMTACHRVWLDGVPNVVPVGTTLCNILEGMGSKPPSVGGVPLRGIRVERAMGAAVLDATSASSGYKVGGGRSIRLDWRAGTAADAAPTWLSLPLFPGDHVRTASGGNS